MFKAISNFIGRSFQRKLLLFMILVVGVTTITLFIFLMMNFRNMTSFSLQQNTTSMEQTVEDYLTKYAQEKATSTWLQIDAAQSNIAVLGKTAQKIIDNSGELESSQALQDLSLFVTHLQEKNGGKASFPEDKVDVLIPPEIVADPGAEPLLRASGLLNLSIDAVYEANANNAFIYFVGNKQVPVTRAYPNIQLIDVLGEGINLLFWRDYFAPNVPNWERWYTDPALRAAVPSPMTVEAPYMDAAGQGLMVTMWYPLWDQKTNTFAGAVAADITLNKVIENVLSIKVAETGFAFLLNGKGEIIAMPEAGYKLLDINVTETQQGGLSYLSGLLKESSDGAVQIMADALMHGDQGIYKLPIDQGNGVVDKQLVAYASMPALSDFEYNPDQWRIVIVAPESEIFAALNRTHQAITNQSASISGISLAMMLAFLAAAVLISTRFSKNVTRDLSTLSHAADEVSNKNYDVVIDVKSQDEIGHLGRTFQSMTREIRDYTTNLETKVKERTYDLQQANEQITHLNAKLKDENLRLSAELDVARRLQMMVLPSEEETRSVPDLDISAYMQPADEVGGDYYDVLKYGPDVYLSIGDVTGHGLPSGVVMLMAQTSMRTISQSGEKDMKRMLSLLNQVLYDNILRIHEDKNMTLAIIRYNDRKYSIVGQHETVLVCRKDHTIENIETFDLGFPVGLEANIDNLIYIDNIELQPGDVMALYTDGITEAENVDGQMFGLGKLKESLARHRDLDADGIRNAVIKDVEDFIGDNKVYDDISIMVIKQK